MTGPPWLAGVLAALMLLAAAVAAGRLCWRSRARRSDASADALHVLMGVAMAGMFEPAIGPVPAIAWQVVIAAAAAWFTWQAISRRSGSRAAAMQSHPAAHVVECGAMLYMLWPAEHRGAGMPGMAAHAGAIAGNPAIALVLAIGMLGYLIWAVDQRLSRQRRGVALSPGEPDAPPPDSAQAALLAPRLAAWQRITMGLAMGYMLVTML